MNPAVTVVIPSTGRPEQLRECIAQLLTTAPEVEIVTALVPGDAESRAVVEKFEIVKIIDQDGEPPAAVKGWNDGAAISTGDNIVLGADDLWFYDGWYEEALKAMASVNNYGLVGLNDLSPHEGNLATHYMVSRAYAVSEWGGVIACPHYRHYFPDMEATIRAKRDGRYIWAEKAIAEHRHHVWGKSERDGIYEVAIQKTNEDSATFEDRQKVGFPNDYSPSFGLIREQPEGWGRVAVGYRMYKTPDPDFVNSLVKMVGNGLRAGDRVFEPVIGQPGHLAANHLARALLATDADSLLMVDDDMVFDYDALHLLRSNPDTFDTDVVFGFCTHRTLPPHAVVMELMEQPGLPVSLLGEQYGTLRDIEDGAVIDVDAVGLAFTLIKRHVFEAMLGEHGALYTSWFNWGPHTEGEDIRFSRKCRQHGFTLAVDTNVKIGHVGRYTFTWDDHQNWLIQEKNNG